MKRVTAPLGLSAVLLDPISSTQPLLTIPREIYDNNSSALLASSSSSLFTNHIFNIEAARTGKVAKYMAATRQGGDDRHQKGPKALGFSNCFQSQEMIDLSLSLIQPSEAYSGVSLNGFKERRTLNPGPELDASLVESNPKPENLAVKRNNQSQGNLRSMVAQRRRQEREREREDEDSLEGAEQTRAPKTEETQATSMQRKLVQMWDCLQVSNEIEIQNQYC